MNSEKFFINNAEEIVPPVNDSPYKRIFVFGDVHAAFDKLQSLLKKISFSSDDLAVFVGDYLYGLGEQNIETLQWLIEHNKRKNIIFLRGNVDDTYLDKLFDLSGNFFDRLNSRVILGIKNAAIKDPFLTNEIFYFLKSLPLSYCITIGGRKYFFCHAGINIKTPLETQTKNYLLNHPNIEDFYSNYSGNDVIIVGHKSPKKIFAKLPHLLENVTENLDLSKPVKVPGRNILMLDTNAKEGGSLSCVEILSGEIYQSSETIDSILFICSGNSCRSPMAKYIMRHLLAQRNLDGKISVDSAGCNARKGGAMSQRACEILHENKIPFDGHIFKRFSKVLYKKFKCIVALDSDMLQKAKEISGGDLDNKIRLFTDLDAHEFNVEDPLYTGNYRKAYEDIYRGCSTLLKEIFECQYL